MTENISNDINQDFNSLISKLISTAISHDVSLLQTSLKDSGYILSVTIEKDEEFEQ